MEADMPSASEIVSTLGPATGLLIIVLLVAVKSLWTRYTTFSDTIAKQNVLLADHLATNTVLLSEMHGDIKKVYDAITSGSGHRST